MTRRWSAVLALALLLSGCGGSRDDASAPAPPSPPSASTPSPSVSAAEAATVVDAEGVIVGLGMRLPTVKSTVIYNAETDPNQKLGRPGGYTSKAAFTDSRVDSAKAQDTDPGAVDLGGGVEVFANEDAARARGTTIQQAQAATGVLAREYQFVSGGVLLRLAAGLTPDEAATFGPALAEVTGRAADPIVVG